MHFFIYILSTLFFLFQQIKIEKRTEQSDGSQIKIVFENIQNQKGTIRIAVYNSENNFLDPEKAASFHSFKVEKKGEMEAVLENIPTGEYAIAVFHDENNNEILETNFFGIPVEPYCFSGEGHSKWRPPYYKDAKFTVDKSGTTLRLQLQKWKL